MDTGIEHRLEHALAVAPSEQAQLLLMDAVTESERKAGMGAFARLGRRTCPRSRERFLTTMGASAKNASTQR
jgi:hypothetical protein